MITREILIANTKTQTRNKLMSSAATLRELKAELDRANIDYTDMTFTEGISKTQLLNDDSLLPQNVMFHGKPTNNLVILLTNTKKKIASGSMSRAEAYSLINKYNIKDAIKAKYGRNYTQIPTAELENAIASINKSDNDTNNTAIARQEEKQTNAEVSVPENTKLPATAPAPSVSSADAVLAVVSSLVNVGILAPQETIELSQKIETLAVQTCCTEKKDCDFTKLSDNSSSSFSDNDINDIINSVL